MRRSIRKGWPSGALKVVNDKRNLRYLTKQEEGQLRGEIAHAYFIFGVDDKAIGQPATALVPDGKSAYGLLVGWAGGMAEW